MSQLSESPPVRDSVAELQRRLHDNSSRIAEFEAMGVELRLKPRDARIADMIRINADTISTLRRSAELLEQRLKHVESNAGGSA